MIKKLILLVVLVVVAILLIVVFKVPSPISSVNNNISHDATYSIAGQPVKLVDGVSEVPAAPGSASKISTKYFGNEVKFDFDGDGREDSAFLVTQETGGSGTFFYLVARLNKSTGPVGTEAVLIGDRIAPQSTNMAGSNVVVNYADRNPGESFDIQPSLGKSLTLKFDPANSQFGEVVQNFEGEANPSMMTLQMKKWNWQKTVYDNGRVVNPRMADKFALTFKSDGTVSISTDCNSAGGSYVVNGNNIAFSQMMSTMMYCTEAQESQFLLMLGDVQSYHFTTKGELYLEMKTNKGSMIFN